MAKITAQMVKELREKSGAGMMECKKALVEAQGDMDKAQEIIEKSGHKKAAKKATRTAAEGIICYALNAKQDKGCLLEINCETDFVAKDANFIEFSETCAKIALDNACADVDNLLTQSYASDQNVDQARQALIAKIGENIKVRRLALLSQENGQIGVYKHGNRIGVMVQMSKPEEQVAKDVCMHIAALNPEFTHVKDVPSHLVDREKDILMTRAKESGKPENILEKIVQGQLSKYLNEITLEGQPFVKDPDQSVGALLKSKGVEVIQFIRFEVGEGIEVEEKLSFQEEVMAQARGSE